MTTSWGGQALGVLPGRAAPPPPRRNATLKVIDLSGWCDRRLLFRSLR
jgi:hypothetical protein